MSEHPTTTLFQLVGSPPNCTRITSCKPPGTQLYSNHHDRPQQEGELFGGELLGTQTGHCVRVEEGSLLTCYFNFHLVNGAMTGRITAEALFDLNAFPNANLVITGGTGDFTGIKGGGCTTTVPTFEFEGTTFIYNFVYDL